MDIKELSAYGLTSAIFQVIENGFTFNEETGEIFFTSDDLETLQEALDVKLNNIAGYCKYNEAKADSLKKRKDEIDKDIKYYQKKAESMNKLLGYLMEKNNIEETKDVGDYRIGFRKSTAVEISDENSIMDFVSNNPEYKENCIKEETKTSIIKTGLKELINNGIDVPGASIVVNKNVTIK